MKTYLLKHVNAFTDRPFSGNPAGVVLDARGLSDLRMQAVAREMNLSETAFILPPSVRNADIQIRWFTPGMEVPLCGHATIAAFHALSTEGMAGMKTSGTYRFRVQTKSGILGVVVEKKYSASMIEFQIPLPKFKPMKDVSPALLNALGISAGEVEPRLPFVRQSYLYLPLKRFSTVKAMKPDSKKLFDFLRATRTLGISVFSLKTIEKSSAVHSRFFAPAAGIDEDPVTGSANGPLGWYLYTYVVPGGFSIPSFILPDGRVEFIGEQGDVIGRRGRVKIRLRVSGEGVEHLSIAGEAVTIMDSLMDC